MEQPDQERNQSPVTALRLGFIGLAVAALLLGYVGFGHDHGPGASPLDLLYASLQLFVLDAEVPEDGSLSWQLQVARFAAPAATVFAVVETARVLLTSELLRLRARGARQHVVVCGDSAVARTLAGRLHAAGRRVIVIGTPPVAGQTAPRRRLYGVPGDPTSAEVLRAAGVGRAEVVYACTGDSTDNLLTATTADRLRHDSNSTLRVYAQIHDPELCLALQARRLSQPHRGALRLDFFNAEELAARSLFLTDPLPPGRPPRLLIVGVSPFGRAVLVEAARHWRLRGAGSTGRLHVDLAAEGGGVVVRDLLHRYPFLAEVCEVEVYADGAVPGSFTVPDSFAVPHDRVFVCHRNEEQSLKVALTTPSLWRGAPGSVVVPVSRLSGLAAAFSDDDTAALLDAVSGTVRLYPVVESASDPARIGDDLVERLARSIHDRYLLAHARGSRGGVHRAMVPWADLPEDLRRTNRSQAEDIGRKLELVGLALAPRTITNVAVSMTDDQVELLAALEHQRWRAEREAAGWRCGERRDADARTHPDLCDWADLPEDTREKNRREMWDLPNVLADVGLEMVRAGSAGEPALPTLRGRS